MKSFARLTTLALGVALAFSAAASANADLPPRVKTAGASDVEKIRDICENAAQAFEDANKKIDRALPKKTSSLELAEWRSNFNREISALTVLQSTGSKACAPFEKNLSMAESGDPLMTIEKAVETFQVQRQAVITAEAQHLSLVTGKIAEQFACSKEDEAKTCARKEDLVKAAAADQDRYKQELDLLNDMRTKALQ